MDNVLKTSGVSGNTPEAVLHIPVRHSAPEFGEQKPGSQWYSKQVVFVHSSSAM